MDVKISGNPVSLLKTCLSTHVTDIYLWLPARALGCSLCGENKPRVLLDFSLSVKAATLIFICGRGSAISSAKEGKSGFVYNLVKS